MGSRVAHSSTKRPDVVFHQQLLVRVRRQLDVDFVCRQNRVGGDDNFGQLDVFEQRHSLLLRHCTRHPHADGHCVVGSVQKCSTQRRFRCGCRSRRSGRGTGRGPGRRSGSGRSERRRRRCKFRSELERQSSQRCGGRCGRIGRCPGGRNRQQLSAVPRSGRQFHRRSVRRCGCTIRRWPMFARLETRPVSATPLDHRQSAKFVGKIRTFL